ncbi:MAG: hypothetical protein FWF09_00870 [Bacteroidales bacterium]|nr:hypothetical protein [Bacteroidales bacterium]
MIDLIKKLYDWENNPDLIKNIEDFTDGEIIEQFEKKDKVSFFERLFQMVEAAKEQEKKIPFRVFFLNSEALVLIVKVKGLYAQLPLQKMAWSYPDMEYWKLIFPTLQGVEFKCNVIEAEPAQETDRFHIVVDASTHVFNMIELIEDAEYTGIVLHKTEDEVLIDIGFHFKWKRGSLCGYLPTEELSQPETFQSCQPGDKITVEYKGKDDRGLMFVAPKVIDPVEEYIGKITWVQVVRGENTMPYFMIEGKYKGDLPVTKTHYPTKKKKVRKLREQWENGDIIQCEILEYKPHRGFIIKWIDDEPDEINWKSDELTAYVGQKVPVYVYWTDEDELSFLVENQYPATLSGRDRSSRKEHLVDGQVITAHIRSIDLENKCFKIRWVSWWDTDETDDDNDYDDDGDYETDSDYETENDNNNDD